MSTGFMVRNRPPPRSREASHVDISCYCLEDDLSHDPPLYDIRPLPHRGTSMRLGESIYEVVFKYKMLLG